MPTTFPLLLPTDPAPMLMELGPLSVAGVNTAPSTLKEEKFRGAGRRLDFALSYSAMKRAPGDELSAILTACDGPWGTLLFGPSGPGATPKGAATGTPLVNGASQVGQSLVTDGWTFNITGILKRGDWIQLGTGALSRLHYLLNSPNSDGSGNATLDLYPQLIESPADNSAIVVASPKGIFHLKERVHWAIGPGYIYQPISFEIVQEV